MEETLESLKLGLIATKLKEIDYSADPSYVPSTFALLVVNVIKLITGDNAENKTPLMHYKMLDTYALKGNTINLCFRGAAKTTLIEYIIWCLALFGSLPEFGSVSYGIYVGDAMDSGVRKMKRALDSRWNSSPFLQQYIPKIKLTESIWEFWNCDDVKLVFTGHGAKTGIRGSQENNVRPQLALVDDLVSDKDAKSPTLVESLRDLIYKSLIPAMHQVKYKIIWNGTPFNENDPLYSSAESGAWNVNVFPVCEKFPCTREDFRGAWEDRFSYDVIQNSYDTLLGSGNSDAFNQEFMLNIVSAQERLITDDKIKWYSLDNLLKSQDSYNYYITTDFGYTRTEANDYSVISVWAVDSSDRFFYVDGMCCRQLMSENIDSIFHYVQKWRPLSVGFEISGQQCGYISILEQTMEDRRCYFHLASNKEPSYNSRKSYKPTTFTSGIRPTTKMSKFVRFQTMLPYFDRKKFYFPVELKETYALVEGMHELSLVTSKGFKSRHDDFLDSISMLSLMPIWRPSDSPEDSTYEHSYDETSNYSSYVV